MKRLYPLLLLAVCMLVSGCMKNGSLTMIGGNKDIEPPLKKIWVMPFPSTGENAFSEKFGNSLKKVFGAEKSLFLVNSHLSDYKALPERLPLLPGGRINNSTLSSIAEEAGIQAVGVYSAVDVSVEEKYTETMYLSKTRWFLKAFFSFSVYDTETSSKLCDFYIEEKVKISKEEFDEYSKSPEKISEASVSELFNQASLTISEKALDALSKVSWKAFIVSVNGNKARISSGKEALVKPGDEMDVFSLGQIFEGKDGFRYRIPGDIKGKIKIEKSENYYSEAEIPGGLTVVPGMTLKPSPMAE